MFDQLLTTGQVVTITTMPEGHSVHVLHGIGGIKIEESNGQGGWVKIHENRIARNVILAVTNATWRVTNYGAVSVAVSIEVESGEITDTIENLDGSKLVAKPGGEFWFYDDTGIATYVIAHRAPDINDDSTQSVGTSTRWCDTSDPNVRIYFCTDPQAGAANWSSYYATQDVYDYAANIWSALGFYSNSGMIEVVNGSVVFGSLYTAPTDYDGTTINASPNQKANHFHSGSVATIGVDLDVYGFSASVGSVFCLTCDSMASIPTLNWTTMSTYFAGSPPSNLSGGQTVEVCCIAAGMLTFRVY